MTTARKIRRNKKLTLHLVQCPSIPAQPLKTLKGLKAILAERRIQAGDWVLLPEMWPALFFKGDRIRQRVENALCFHWLKDFARTHRCFLSGSMLEMPGRRIFNSAFVIGPTGKLLGSYRKIHLFPLTGEHRNFTPGNKIQVVKLPQGKLGLAICYDLRFPEMFRELSRRGARILFIPSAWPRERLDHFRALLKARAIENQCFVVAVNKCGPERDGLVFAGHSMVLDPWGRILGEMGARKGILRMTIDLGRVQEIRKRFPFLEK